MAYFNGKEILFSPNVHVVKVDAEGTIEITKNGEYDVTKSATAKVNVPQDSGSIVEVVSLPTENIDESVTYGVLNAAFFDGKKFRQNATCYVVEWGKTPSGAGEEAFQERNGEPISVGYYDARTGTVWFYFGSGSRQVLSNMIDAREDLSATEKFIAKLAVNALTGWKNTDDILNLVGDKISLPGGEVINSLDEVTDVNKEYLFLYKELFVYENGIWVNLDSTDEYVRGLVENIENTTDYIVYMLDAIEGGANL